MSELSPEHVRERFEAITAPMREEEEPVWSSILSPGDSLAAGEAFIAPVEVGQEGGDSLKSSLSSEAWSLAPRLISWHGGHARNEASEEVHKSLRRAFYQAALGHARSLSQRASEDDPVEALATQYGSEVRTWAGSLVETGNVGQDADQRERFALDLQYVIRRLRRLYTHRQATIWLESHNQMLGSRPIDAIVVRGVASVLEAVDVEEQRAYG